MRLFELPQGRLASLLEPASARRGCLRLASLLLQGLLLCSTPPPPGHRGWPVSGQAQECGRGANPNAGLSAQKRAV